ncbi:hypothetical protein R1flu_027358 [Riccia fluitans]|uniref:Uncharacterized protein n=1 Tax=Riccia fluitans TaxID=41844 RepID=A0ABD1XJ37_9MARC
MIEALEKEKSEMNARVALMERKDLYDFLEAKMEGFQIANHPGTIGGFENLNPTITKKWVEIPTLNLEEFGNVREFPEVCVACKRMGRMETNMLYLPTSLGLPAEHK